MQNEVKVFFLMMKETRGCLKAYENSSVKRDGSLGLTRFQRSTERKIVNEGVKSGSMGMKDLVTSVDTTLTSYVLTSHHHSLNSLYSLQTYHKLPHCQTHTISIFCHHAIVWVVAVIRSTHPVLPFLTKPYLSF